MAGDKPPSTNEPGGDPNLLRILWRDLVHGDFDRMFRRDLKDFYYFYLDDERRRRLMQMSRFKQALYVLGWVVRELFLRLAPARRILLVACLVIFFWGSVQVRFGDTSFTLNLRIFSFAGLLFILMLELKDKLLARDELAVGRAVQLALLPDRNPELAGWSIWLYTRPANDVGGDLVDCLELGPGRVGFTLADVAGKALPAALLMAKVQATLRALATDAPSLSALAAKTNNILCRDGLPNRFATLVYLDLRDNVGSVRLVNGGHMPPVLVSGDRFHELQRGDMALGMMPGAAYREQHQDVQPGEMLVAYSDGLTEALNAAGEFYGEERLHAVFAQLAPLSAKEAGARILESVDAFIGATRPYDDLSLIVLKRI